MSNYNNGELRWIHWLLLAGIVTLAFGARMIPYRQCFEGDRVYLYGQDPYYHFMRIRQAAFSQCFHLPDTDPRAGYPDGFQPFWPPYFDQAVAVIGWILGGGHPSENLLLHVAAWLPPILGALTAIPVFFIGLPLFTRKVALLAALVFALLPGHASYCVIGRIDHHFAEIFFPLCLYAFYLAARKAFDRGKPRASIVFSILAGICLAGSYLVWPGATLYLGVLAFDILWIVTSGRVGIRGRGINRIDLLMLGTALILLLPACTGSWWGKRYAIEFDALSWFQPGVIAGLMAYAIYLKGALYRWRSVEKPLSIGMKKRILIGWAIPAFAGACALLAIPSLRQAVLNGLGYLNRTDPWLEGVTEAQPLFSTEGIFLRFWAEALLSYGVYLVPLALALVLFQGRWKVKLSCQEPVFFFILTGLSLLVTLGQKRFTYFSTAPVAVSMAWLSVLAGDWVVNRAIPAARWTSRLRTLAAILLLVVSMWPALKELRGLSGRYIRVPSEIEQSLLWLRENSPAPDSEQPEYGVMGSSWSFGHWIQYFADRPVLNNGFHRNRKGNTEAIRVLLARHEKNALEALERNRVRYLVLSELSFGLPAYARILSEQPGQLVQIEQGEGSRRYYRPGPEYQSIVGNRLYLFDGLVSAPGQPPEFSQRLRLVHESPERLQAMGYLASVVKIFEFVPGAILSGQTRPGGPVELKGQVKTPGGRQYAYRCSTVADASGAFELRAPYSMASEAQVGFTEPPKWNVEGQSRELILSEDDVISGRKIAWDEEEGRS